MNKKLIVCLALVMMATCLCVSASELTTKDFGNFTVDVPSDSSFEDSAFVPAGTVVSFTSTSSLTYPDEAIIESQTDDENDLEIYYLDFDSYDGPFNSAQSFKDSVVESGGVNQNVSGDYDVYKNPKDSDYKYEAVVQKKGFLSLSNEEKIVVIEGDDLDLLTQMADSVKFK